MNEKNNHLAIELYKDDRTAPRLQSPAPLTPNWRAHVAVSYDFKGDGKSSLHLYIDRIPASGTETAVGSTTANPTPLEIGCYNWSGSYQAHFQGQIDDVFVSNKALSKDEIQKLMNGPVATP